MKYLIFLIVFLLFKEFLCTENQIKITRHIYHNGQILSDLSTSASLLSSSSSLSQSKLHSDLTLSSSVQKKFIEINSPIFKKNFRAQNSTTRTLFTTIINTNQLLVLDGTQLHAFVTYNNSISLYYISRFKTKNEGKIEMFKALLYQNNLILVLATSELIEVYQINYDKIEEEFLKINQNDKGIVSEDPFIKTDLQSLQRIKIFGELHKIFLYGVTKTIESTSNNSRRPRNNPNISVYLVAAIKYNFLEGKLSTYKWSESTFNTVDKKSIRPFDDLFMFENSGIFHILAMQDQQQNEKEQTRILVYKFEKRKDTFIKILSHYFESKELQIFEFDNTIMVAECHPNENNCLYFKLIQEQFEQYKITSGTRMAILNGTLCEKIAAFEAQPDFIACIRKNKLYLFGDEHFEAVLLKNVTLNGNVSEIIRFSNFYGKMFLLLSFYGNANNSEIYVKVYDINKLEEIDIIGDARSVISEEKQILLETYIKNLRNLLIGREKQIQEMAKTLKQLDNIKIKVSNETGKLILNSKLNVMIPEGQIKTVNVINQEIPNSLNTIKTTVSELKSLISNMKNFIHHRSKRNLKTGNETIQIKNLYVKNLTIVNENESDKLLYQAIIPSKEDLLIFKKPIETKTINTRSFNLKQNFSNIKNDDIKDREDTDTDIPISNGTNDTLIKDEPKLNNNHLKGSIKFHSIEINEINTINWNHMYENEMLHDDKINIINGNLRIHQPSGTITEKEEEKYENIIKNLNIKEVNGIQVKDLFTMNTEQKIDSTILISSFFIQSMEVEKLNSLDIEKDIARTDIENYIKSPVTIEKLSILKKLNLDEESKRTFARHIFGTKYEDFRQIYTGEITINGSLTLQNLNSENEQSEIWIKDQLIDLDFNKNYWLKNIDQEITVPVKLISPVTFSTITTEMLNDYPLQEYILRNKNLKKPINLIFKNVQIKGNITDNTNSNSQIEKINENVILKDSKYIIKSPKHFLSKLKVNELSTLQINDIKTTDFIKKNVKITDLKKKNLKYIKVLKEFEIDSGLYVKKSLNDILNVSETLNQYFENKNKLTDGKLIITEPVKLKNIEVEYLNGYNIYELLNIFQLDKNNYPRFILNKTVTIEGNVTFENHLTVTDINGINWDNYLNSLILKNDNNPYEKIYINEKQIFKNKVLIGNAIINKLNGETVKNFFGNILMSSIPQTVNGKWKFKTLKVKNLQTNDINNVHTGLLLDVTDPNVNINSNLKVENITANINFNGKFNKNFYEMKEKLQYIINGTFDELMILKGAEMPLHENLKRLFTQSVNRYSYEPQIIQGDVIFKDEVKFKNLSYYLENDSDDKNIISEILTDALYKKSDLVQEIYGIKKFRKGIVNDLIVNNLLDVCTINDIDIKEFNQSLYRKQYFETIPINGIKQFKYPLNIQYLYTAGKINKISMENLVFANNEEIWPKLCLNNDIYVENLYLNEINHMEFDFFIKNRLKLHGPGQEIHGHLTFNELKLTEYVQLHSINDIPIDDLVFQHSNEIQEILGHKKLFNSSKLEMIGPTTIINLNEKDLIQKYRSTIFLNADGHLKNLNVMNSIKFENKLNINKTINNENVIMYQNWYNYKYNQLNLKLNEKFKYIFKY